MLVLRVAPVAPHARLVIAWLGGAFVLVNTVARLVETVHPLTDLVGAERHRSGGDARRGVGDHDVVPAPAIPITSAGSELEDRAASSQFRPVGTTLKRVGAAGRAWRGHRGTVKDRVGAP